MSKRNFHLSKGLKSNIIYALPALAFVLFAAAIVFPVVPANTHAEGDEPEEGITVIASSDISVNLLSKDEGYYKIFKDSIKVSTSSENGYTLSIATDSADHQTLYLNSDTSSESKIDGTTGTYEDPKALGDYEWGFAVPGISHFDDTYSTTNPSEDSKFAILPLENKIIRDYTEAATENVTDIYYGFKLSGTLEPGEYKTNITYTAVPASQPLVARAILGQNKNLNFVYDRKTYTPGETYMDNLEETIISDVYLVPKEPTSGSLPWNRWPGPSSVNFDLSFYGFEPTSTERWFLNCFFLTSVTNARNLNTSQVISMKQMFYQAGLISNASTWTADFSEWDVSSVTDMSYLFGMVGSSSYDITSWSVGDLSEWDTSNVTNMSHMFERAGRGTDADFDIRYVSKWDVSSVTDMSYMFAESGRLANWNLDLSGWDTGRVTNMSYMFYGINASGFSSINLGIGGWDTSNVTNMSHMFEYAGGYNTTIISLEIGGWDTGSVTDMSYMFYGMGRYVTDWSLNLGGWNTENVTKMNNMFFDAGRYSTSSWNLDLSDWNTKNVTDMSHMFQNAGRDKAEIFSLNLSGWGHTEKVTDMSYMFSYAGYYTVYSLDLSGWNTSSLTNMSHMFEYASYRDKAKYDGGNARGTAIFDLSDWNTSKVTDMSHLFDSAGSRVMKFNIIGLDDWDTDNVVDMSYLFNYAGAQSIYYSIGDVSGWRTGNVSNMSHMFSSASHNSNLTLNLVGWDTSNVVDMSWMFASAGSGLTITGIANWNTGNVINMSHMFDFAGAYNNLVVGDLSGWNVSNVTDMSYMFADAGVNSSGNLNIGKLSSWDTSKVTDMSYMFASAGGSGKTFSLDLSSWNVSNVTNMSYMFKDTAFRANNWSIGNLGYVDTEHPGWNTSKVTNMKGMFYSSHYSTSSTATRDVGNISGWDVSNVADYTKFVNKEYNYTTIQTDADLPGDWTFDNI